MALKKIKKKTPGGRTVIHTKPKKTSKKKCALCSAVLPGVARGRKIEIKRLAKSKMVPKRPFGGVLCSKCSRKIQLLRIRLKAGIIKDHEIPISLKNYVM